MDDLDRLRADIRDLTPDHLKRIILRYHFDYSRTLETLMFARWLLVAHFALWCVWLA